jgi:hypothetical protein
MKYLPTAVLTMAIVLTGVQTSAQAQQASTSTKPPKEVATCIAQAWADKTQQSVTMQNTLANDQGIDVYVPGQQPPNGAAASVSPAGNGGSRVWYRAAGQGGDAGSDIAGCL